MFQEILLPLSGKVNDYVAYIYSKYPDQGRKNRTSRPGWEVVAQCNQLN